MLTYFEQQAPIPGAKESVTLGYGWKNQAMSSAVYILRTVATNASLHCPDKSCCHFPLLPYFDFLYHMKNLKPRERTSGIKVVASSTIHSRDQLPHMSCKVILWRHFRCNADAGVSETRNRISLRIQLNYEFLNVFLAVHHDTSVQQVPTGRIVYFQFISVINLYMFRAGLLLIIRRYYSVDTAIIYTNYCIYRVVPSDDEEQDCSKHVEVNYWNKLKVNSASCWFFLHGYITMHGQQNIEFNWLPSVVLLVVLIL